MFLALKGDFAGLLVIWGISLGLANQRNPLASGKAGSPAWCWALSPMERRSKILHVGLQGCLDSRTVLLQLPPWAGSQGFPAKPLWCPR